MSSPKRGLGCEALRDVPSLNELKRPLMMGQFIKKNKSIDLDGRLKPADSGFKSLQVS